MHVVYPLPPPPPPPQHFALSSISLGTTVIPRRNWKQWLYKIWGAKQYRYRAFSLTWPASIQINWNKRKRLHKKRVQIPQDCLGTPTWLPFYCFGTPIWPP